MENLYFEFIVLQLKAMQHELGCMTALLRAKYSDLKKGFNKRGEDHH